MATLEIFYVLITTFTKILLSSFIAHQPSHCNGPPFKPNLYPLHNPSQSDPGEARTEEDENQESSGSRRLQSRSTHTSLNRILRN